MAKFMLIKIGLMAEITDADTLRDAALKDFDAADITSPDHPDTADWHASEEGQEKRRQIATQDMDALNQFVDGPRLRCCSTACPASRPLLGLVLASWRALRGTRPAKPGRNARGLHGGASRLGAD